MTSGEQPVYEYRVASWVPFVQRLVERYRGDEQDTAKRMLMIHDSPSWRSVMERRQVGPWEKVEQ